MSDQYFRYCEACGHRFETSAPVCPECGEPWEPATLPGDRHTARALLELLQAWRRSNLLPASSYSELTKRVERVFESGTPPEVPAAASETSLADLGERPASALQAHPQHPPGPGFGALLAARQADILLYLGAFLLSIAALIFVAYQQDAVSLVIRMPLLAAYTTAGVAGGILVRRWERVREAGHVFLGLGSLLVPLNFVLLYTDVLSDREVPGDVVWLIASCFCGVFYAALARAGFGWLYRIPAVIALLSAWTSVISILSIPSEWGGAWYMLLAAVIAVAGSIRWPRAVVGAAVLGGFSLLWSYAAIAAGGHHWQLAATHAIAAAAIGWSSHRLRIGPGLIAFLFVAAATVAATMWPLGVPSPTFAYPFLVSGAVALLLRRRARRWPGFTEGLAWAYAGAVSVAPIVALNPEDHLGWSGLGFMGSAVTLAFFAWQNVEHGLTASLGAQPGVNPSRTSPWERAAYAWAATGYALAGAALWQQQIGVSEPERGWLFAVIAVLPAVAVAVSGRLRSDEALGAAIPISAVAALVAQPPEGHHLFAAAFLALPGAAWVLASLPSRRPTAALIGAIFLALAAFALRAEYRWEYWQLAAGFSVIGLVLFTALIAWRRYPTHSESDVCALLLSWGLHAVAIATVLVRIDAFQSDRIETGRRLTALIVERADYRLLVALAWLLAGMVGFEALRLGKKQLGALLGSALAMAAVLLTIGLANPHNVQFYTVPAGLYLVALGIVIRRSAQFIPPHLDWHETALLAGVALIVLPQAEQSFDPGGAWWGLVLIGEGLLFLALGLILQARWLVPCGTLVLSGVAIRWLLESGNTVPYWLTLGVLGTLLLAGGMFVLANIERWNRARARASRWWQETGRTPPAPDAPRTPAAND